MREALHAFLGVCVSDSALLYGFGAVTSFTFSAGSEALQKLSAPCSVGQSCYCSSAISVILKSVKLPLYLQE